MRLKKLSLSNFQGIKSFEFEPDGHNANVYGTNAAGKTTLFNALTWLLFDKSSTGEKGFSPKTKDASGNDIHYLEHRVDGVFQLDDGAVVSFGKVLKEEWVKKRGSNIESFSGHTTDYYIDGVPSQKKEFDSALEKICSSENFQILTQPMFFPESLSWQRRREILLEVCGDITDYDVINSSDELHKITEFLQKPGTDGLYSVDEYKKIAAATGKEINERLKEIPARIDEANRSMPDIAGIDTAKVQQSIKALTAEIESIQQEKAALGNDEAAQKIRREIADLNTELAEARAAHSNAYEDSVKADRERVRSMNDKLSEYQSRAFGLKQTIQNMTDKLRRMNEQRESLAARYKETQAKEWSGDTVCPTCGQAMPEGSIAEAKERFNKAKAETLEKLREQIEAECSKVLIADAEGTLAAAQTQLAEVEALTEAQQAEIQKVKDGMAAPVEFINTEEYARISAAIRAKQEELTSGNIDTAKEKEVLQGKIDALKANVRDEEAKLLAVKSAETQKARVAELAAEEKRLSAEYEKIQEGLYLCDEFIKAKVSMLSDNINNRFESVKFRLFVEQINGGIKEDCEVLIPTDNGLVPFSTANNAARINAGLEIIDTLSRHWGITMPIFIDNAESVVKLKDIGAQVIRLIVSGEDSSLRVEIV
jgi:DNA repair exonuclease SbcCD ATPase subunit